MKKNYINFISQLTSEEILKNMPSISNAAYLFQNKVIKAINPNSIISILPLPCTGLQGNIIYNERKYLNGRGKNYKLLKVFYDYFDAIKILKKGDINLYYSLNVQSFFIVFYSRFFLQCKNYIIVADFELVKNYKNFFRKLLQFIINKTYSFSDGVIVLNENIKIHKNTKVFSALVDEEFLAEASVIIENNSILFSGSIGLTTGIEIAIRAMDFLPDFKLYITGKLYFFEENRLISLINNSQFKNIIYLGNIDYEVYKTILEKVEFALSLRNPKDLEHNFNFPSKIVEYLASNKKVISTLSYKSLDKHIIFLTEFDPIYLAKVVLSLKGFPQPNYKEYLKNKFGLIKFREVLGELLSNNKIS